MTINFFLPTIPIALQSHAQEKQQDATIDAFLANTKTTLIVVRNAIGKQQVQ